jgi:hypothetical protein
MAQVSLSLEPCEYSKPKSRRRARAVDEARYLVAYTEKIIFEAVQFNMRVHGEEKFEAISVRLHQTIDQAILRKPRKTHYRDLDDSQSNPEPKGVEYLITSSSLYPSSS